MRSIYLRLFSLLSLGIFNIHDFNCYLRVDGSQISNILFLNRFNPQKSSFSLESAIICPWRPTSTSCLPVQCLRGYALLQSQVQHAQSLVFHSSFMLSLSSRNTGFFIVPKGACASSLPMWACLVTSA